MADHIQHLLNIKLKAYALHPRPFRLGRPRNPLTTSSNRNTVVPIHVATSEKSFT